MRYSEQTSELFAALAEFQGVLTPPPKNRTVTVQHKAGGQHSFAYAELGTIWTHISEAYRKGGFFWVSDVTYDERGRASLVTRIGHKSGQWMESDFPLPSMSDTKGFAGEITYARRYSFSMMMGIASQEDADEQPEQRSRQQPRDQRPPRQESRENRDPPRPHAQKQEAAHAGPIQPKAALPAQQPAPAVPPAASRPGQKEREELTGLAVMNKWPLEKIPEYLKLAHRVQRLEQLSMEQYAEVVKVVGGVMAWEEVFELLRPRPGDFGYTGQGPEESK